MIRAAPRLSRTTRPNGCGHSGPKPTLIWTLSSDRSRTDVMPCVADRWSCLAHRVARTNQNTNYSRGDVALRDGGGDEVISIAEGTNPNVRRDVRVRCAASANPAECAADDSVCPAINKSQTCRKRRQRMYGRSPMPVCSTKR